MECVVGVTVTPGQLGSEEFNGGWASVPHPEALGCCRTDLSHSSVS